MLRKNAELTPPYEAYAIWIKRFQVFLPDEAIRAVDVQPADGLRAEEEMVSPGAQRITVEVIALLHNVSLRRQAG